MLSEARPERWPEPITRALLAFQLGCYSLVLLPFALPALLLCLVARSANGRLCGLAVLAWVAAAYVAVVRRARRSRRAASRRVVVALLLVGVALIVVARLRAPTGDPGEGSRARSIYLQGGRFAPSSLANIVPEADQFLLGSFLISPLDPTLDFAQAARLRGLIRDVYGPMAGDSTFVALGSHMNLAYRHLFGLDWDTGHAYVYLPDDPGPLPVLLFLHGSAGNFKGYLWLLRAVAERCRVAIVAPSYGFGEWREPGCVVAVDRCLAWIAEHPRLASDSVVLAGLSNGGKGVTRVATARPDDFRALAYVSPVLESAWLAQLAEVWDPERPVWIVHGAQDRRIPVAGVEAGARQLGAELVVVEGEDHFLLFSQPERVLGGLERLFRRRPR